MSDIQKLYNEMRQAAESVEKLADKFNTDKDGWTSEDEQAFQRANEDVNRLEEGIAKLKRAEEIRAKLNEKSSDVADKLKGEGYDSRNHGKPDTTGDASTANDHAMAYAGWLRGKFASTEERAAASRVGVDISVKERDWTLESRAQSVGLGSAGGYTAPEGVMQPLERAMLQFGAIRPHATILRTTNGNSIPIPTVNDTANSGSDLGENAAVSTTDITFGKLTLNAYKLSSDIVKVSNELLEDSAINIAEVVGSLLGERLARRSENKYATGTGAGDIYGLITAAATGKTTASATAITVDELLDLEASVDPAYRGNAAFMFHADIVTYIRKLKDGNGQYLWQAAVQAGNPGSLLGYPVVTNQEMASTVATTNVTGVFGDLSKYWIRDVNDVRMVRLDERFADNDQVGFMAFLRTDGLLNTIGNPVKKLVQA